MEMTLISFDENEVAEQLKELNNLTSRIKSGEEKTVPAEQVHEELSQELGIEFHKKTPEEKEKKRGEIERTIIWNNKKVEEIVGVAQDSMSMGDRIANI